MVTPLLQDYARRIRELRRASADVPEPALAPAFQQLLEGLLAHIAGGRGLVVVPEYRNPGVGRPDIALVRQGAPPRAFVELKAPDKPADPTRWRAQDQRQFQRFKELPCWATCNFSEFRLFRRDEELGSALVVPERVLRPDQDDARANRVIAQHDVAPLHGRMLAAGAGQEPAARDAEHLATLLAHSARLVRGIVRDRLAELREGGIANHPLLQVRETFRDVLYAHPEAGGYAATDFDQLFSAAFAQTLAFGLLLVREATAQPAGADFWQHMPVEHPLMRTALRVLSLGEVVRDIGIDRAVRANLATQGLRDPNVTILDPASGTGTFLLGVAERIRGQVEPQAGEGMAALALQQLAHRMFGFELLVGPYAVAHYRLHHTLRRPRRQGGEPLTLPRLGVYLADTLAEPGATAPMGPLGFVSDGIAVERREANRIKAEQPILAIIANPPYRRLEEGRIGH